MRKTFAVLAVFFILTSVSMADMTDYCGSGNNISIPPFISAGASPLVMFVMGRDHKLYYEAYNDATDLDGDGIIDIGYTHSIDYYGYFDSYKCYTYSSGDGRFNPSRTTDDKYCGGSSEWSGNFLNWMSMSRIDVLRKVLYGGFRRTDTSSLSVLAGTYIPNDAHSWGKEYAGGDTRQLTPFNAPPASCVLPSSAASWNRTGNEGILMVKYVDGLNNGCGTADTMMSAFSPRDYVSHEYVNTIWDSQAGTVNHGNLMYVTEINVPYNRSGTWYFAINSSDGGEIEVDGVVRASRYGCNDYGSNNTSSSLTGSVYLNSGWHRIVVRVRRDNSGDDIGARISYRRPSSSTWRNFSYSNLNNDGVSLRAPNVSASSTGMCSLKTSEFVESGTPSSGTFQDKRHLFCVTSKNNENNDHSIRVLQNRTERIWQWASIEGSSCGTSIDSNADGTADTGISPTDYYTRVKVCDSSVGEETNCYDYGSGSKKPTGLLQRYGTGSGADICSKTYEASGLCSGDEGILLKESPMYFGMLTGSYEKNISGGVVRKNIGSIMDEINSDGTFKSTTPANGSIIKTLNSLKIDYSGNCGWITNGPFTEGNCKMWGNPIGEMLWETLRYFKGEDRTSAYNYTSGIDSNLGLPKPDWRSPYGDFPYCSKPNIIIISDVNPSYDNNVPASGTFTDYSLSSLYNDISENEGISGNYFIGSNGSTNDFACSEKPLSDIGSALGLCPEEPTKNGTYSTAALAYYAKTKMNENTVTGAGTLPNIDTHAVALASPLPEIKIATGRGTVQMIPMGKSVSGSDINCGFRYDENFGVRFTGTGFCPSNQIVDFYAESITETSGRFRINFEDVEQGADHDMDAIARYDYEVNDDDTITITLTSEYAAGGINQIMGFVITGTTSDGVYIPIRNRDGNVVPQNGSNMPLIWSKTFSVSEGGASAQLLKNPLWYAAKYGGFSEKGNNSIPDVQSEWDEDGDGIPDNYHYITNPLLLEQKFAKVFTDILKRTASGTAPAIGLGKNRGTLINHALFYPEKDFGDSVQSNNIQWAGQLFTYWFFTHRNTQNIMEDSNSNFRLDLCDSGDKILEFRVDEAGSLQIDRYTANCQGSKDLDAPSNSNISIDDVAYLWEGGKKLSQTSAASRVVYTNVDGSLVQFNTANQAEFSDMLGLPESFPACLGTADNLISYILGTDFNGCRSRMLLNGNTYKLGDILNSSPVMVDYPNKTGKPGYTMTYVGANDGMLHAFRAGKVLTSGLVSYQAVKLCNDSADCSTDKIGREEWAFIPKNALPYLRYLADPDYCHIYYNDLAPYILEVKDSAGYVTKRILIGGMRLGGACGTTASSTVKPPADTCADPASSDCVGLSSYYALDVTDQNNPVLLWEFTDPYLAYSFSGPAFITKGNSKYIMFLSGPTNYAGTAGQDLNIFILNLDPVNYTVNQVHKFSGANRSGYTRVSALSSYSNAFGGKLFTNGVDYGSDGDTDVVFFGINQMTGNEGSPNWSGNVMGVRITSENPEAWEFGNVFNSAQKPVTQKVEYMSCFDMKYIYFGTGRWFYKIDEAGINANEHNYLYGVRIDDCIGGNCNLNNAHTSEESCSQLLSENRSFAWSKVLEPKSGNYLMERLLSDPEPVDYADVVFFGTTEPNSDICSFGGRSRVWGLNCATGSAIALSCDGEYQVDVSKVPPIWVPRTPGDISKVSSPEDETTDWKEGAIIGDIQSAAEQDRERKGRLLFWIEK
ncbi:PilC/PilY family type IV pilus protein [Geovibrio sp. ADMFC3]